MQERLAELFQSQDLASSMTAIDLVVIDRTAELAVLLGHIDTRRSLLDGMALHLTEIGDRYGADYVTVRRAALAFDRGQYDRF